MESIVTRALRLDFRAVYIWSCANEHTLVYGVLKVLGAMTYILVVLQQLFYGTDVDECLVPRFALTRNKYPDS